MTYYPEFAPRLYLLYVEAMKEKNRFDERAPIDTDFAIYPMRFYKTVADYDHRKDVDFCFIGGFKTDPLTVANRQWIVPFIQTHFTANSYLQFTDPATKAEHKVMGLFDHTLRKEGFLPKAVPIPQRNGFDENYFKVMCRSRFVLCPAGDAFWSMRFYESLMCKAIPIVAGTDETFRTPAEEALDYKYYFKDDAFEYREDWVAHNYELFLRHHTFEYA